MAQEYKGKSVYKGIVLGTRSQYLRKIDVQVKREKSHRCGERDRPYAGSSICFSGAASETV